MRILYVEDNPELRETIGMLMEGEGRTVTSCASAEEALVLDAGHPFDVLVTDVSLPGMSGTDLARRLLANDPLRWVVVVGGEVQGVGVGQQARQALGDGSAVFVADADVDAGSRGFADHCFAWLGHGWSFRAENMKHPAPYIPEDRARGPETL